MNLPTTFDDTVALLASHGALATGHFKLASGLHSGHYVMKGKLVQYPGIVAELIAGVADQLEALGTIDVVLSPAIGGIPVGQQVAHHLGCRHVFSERDAHNEMVLKRGFEISSGDRVLLVEDVITTGGTLGELLHFVQDQGAEVAGVYVVVNRSGSPRWNDYPVVASMEIVFPTYPEDAIPPELAAIPVTKPGTKQSGEV
jgi:orotate phosphoribosyltransferase